MQYFPGLLKFLFGFAAFHRHEMRPKPPDGSDLIFGEMGKIIIQQPEIMYVAEKLLRIDQMLIHVIKVVQQHIAPIEKVVERFPGTTYFSVMAIKHHQHFNSVGKMIG